MMRHPPRRFLLLGLAVSLVACPARKQDPDPPVTETLAGEILSLTVGEPGWVLTRHGLFDPDRAAVPLPAAEAGHRLSTAWVDPGGATLWLGYEVGRVYRSTDRGATWQAELQGYLVPDVVLIELSLRRPVPRQFVRAADGTLYLATVGRGLMRWDDAAGAWVDGTWRFDLEGSVHPLAWSAAAVGDTVVVGFANPAGIIPPDYTSFFGGLVRTLDAPGSDPEQLPDVEADVRLVADLGERDGRLVVATLGQGVHEWRGTTWRALGPADPPADVIALDVSPAGDLAILTLTADVWLLRGDAWTQVRCGAAQGPRGADLRWDGARLQVGVGADLETFTPVAVSCPDRGGATVLLGFSQHTSLYHSYRGDTNDDDGYGKDIDIIRTTLEIFDRHPQFKNDWDIDNLFTLDGWLASDAPDILADIRRRVEDGQDGVRLMSWNNGLMTNETTDELTASILRAQDSFEAFVPGLWAPGVQPQENTLTPAHVALYPSLGIDWITLFYSATSFTGFRHEVPLSLAEAHGVLSLGSDLDPGASMQLVPVYHHADVLEHGGLANWLRQLHQNLAGTVALVIHFDADGDTWLGFETELEAVEALHADWVVPSRLQDIVAELPTAGTVTLRRDLADGAFDGLSSWTEKPVNHRFYTRIVRSRLAADRALALALAPGPTVDATAQQALDDAFEARLRSLSTTHFGLANPALHPTREATGDASTLEAEQRAEEALLRVLAGSGLTAQAAHNPADTEVTFLQPVTSATALASATGGVRFLHSADGTRQWLAGSLAAGDSVPLDTVDASLVADPAPWDAWGPTLAGVTVKGPRIRVAGVDYGATLTDEQRVTGNGAQVVTLVGAWEPGHGGVGGAVRYDWIHHDADPDAWWVEVTVTYPTLADEELRRWWDDSAPLELALAAADAWTVERPLLTGEVARYVVAEPLDALNAHAADGWVRLLADGSAAGLSIATFQPLRAAPGFLPLRLQRDGGGLVLDAVPFGALWGELLDHRPRSLLGTGLAEMTSRLTGAQFHPTAPAWNGETVCFLLRLQPDTPDGDQDHLLATSRGVLVLDAQGKFLPGRPGCF